MTTITALQAADRTASARFNAAKIEEALTALRAASASLAEAVENIEANESEPESVMGDLKNIMGSIAITTRAVRDESQEWSLYASARGRSRR